MVQQNTDPLEIQSLPTDPRVMALRLLGMTAAELKEVDSNIVGGGKNITGLKLDVNKMVQEFNTTLVPTPTVQQLPPQEHPQHLQSSLPSVQQPVPIAAIPQVDYNKDQLEFDFYKKITPDDLYNQLNNINNNIKNLDKKLNSILEILDTKKN